MDTMKPIRNSISKSDQARLRVLHGYGFSDIEIGAKIGRSGERVGKWRRLLGLKTLPQDCRNRVAKLNKAGKIDREIAEILSRHRPISSVHVSAIRRHLGLKCHKYSKPGSWRRRQDKAIPLASPSMLRISQDKEHQWTELMAGKRFEDYRLR